RRHERRLQHGYLRSRSTAQLWTRGGVEGVRSLAQLSKHAERARVDYESTAEIEHARSSRARRSDVFESEDHATVQWLQREWRCNGAGSLCQLRFAGRLR